MKAYILGLDISTTCCGWALLSVDYDIDRDIRVGKIIPPKSTSKNPVSWFARADHIYTSVDTIFSNVPIAAIGVEQLNSFRGGEVTRQLSAVNLGVQFYFYKKYGIEPIEMNTMTLKKKFTGHGGAQKNQMIESANKRFGLNLRWPTNPSDQKDKEKNDEDIADALAVAWVLYTEASETLRKNLEVRSDN